MMHNELTAQYTRHLVGRYTWSTPQAMEVSLIRHQLNSADETSSTSKVVYMFNFFTHYDQFRWWYKPVWNNVLHLDGAKHISNILVLLPKLIKRLYIMLRSLSNRILRFIDLRGVTNDSLKPNHLRLSTYFNLSQPLSTEPSYSHWRSLVCSMKIMEWWTVMSWIGIYSC